MWRFYSARLHQMGLRGDMETQFTLCGHEVRLIPALDKDIIWMHPDTWEKIGYALNVYDRSKTVEIIHRSPPIR
jgi:hypothetical protein